MTARVEGRLCAVNSEVAPLQHVLLKHPRDAFRDEHTIAAQWRALHFIAAPDLGRATEEFEHVAAILRSRGATVHLLPPDDGTTLDSIYVRDASLVCDRGIVICTMGKPQRANEPAAQERMLSTLGGGLPILGRIDPPGMVEGGDACWLDDRTLAVGRGYRTNEEGIRQVRRLLGETIDVITVPLPHWRGRSDVMHLMSLISPIDELVAVVYPPLLPVPFVELLADRGFTLVEVPDEEFETMGTNVLALAPRRVLVLAGNPRTRAALERAGAEVFAYEGTEISVKGSGGPTCLTRPLVRARTSGPGAFGAK